MKARTALVVIGVLAALVASGSATVEQATAAGMEGVVPYALVALLEVVNVAGTWTWMTDRRTRVQVEAALGVGAASVVTGICGVLSYGPIGVVPAAGVLFTVHLVGRLARQPEAAAPVAPGAFVPLHRHAATPVQPPAPVWGPPTAEDREPVLAPHDPPPVQLDPPPEGDEGADTDEIAVQPPASASGGQGGDPAPASPRLASPDEGAGDQEVLAWIADRALELGRRPGRDAVRKEFPIGAKRATRLLEQHDARPRLSAVKETP